MYRDSETHEGAGAAGYAAPPVVVRARSVRGALSRFREVASVAALVGLLGFFTGRFLPGNFLADWDVSVARVVVVGGIVLLATGAALALLRRGALVAPAGRGSWVGGDGDARTAADHRRVVDGLRRFLRENPNNVAQAVREAGKDGRRGQAVYEYLLATRPAAFADLEDQHVALAVVEVAPGRYEVEIEARDGEAEAYYALKDALVRGRGEALRSQPIFLAYNGRADSRT
jgi:hypothetical protein